MHEFRTFTLQEANETLYDVIRLTDEAAFRLDQINEVWGKVPFKKFDALRGVADEDLVRAEWAHRIASLGVMPKGFFVVDFQSSDDPDTLFCWSYGEEIIEHEHKLWETFAQRIRIGSTPFGNTPPWSEGFDEGFNKQREDELR